MLHYVVYVYCMRDGVLEHDPVLQINIVTSVWNIVIREYRCLIHRNVVFAIADRVIIGYGWICLRASEHNSWPDNISKMQRCWIDND